MKYKTFFFLLLSFFECLFSAIEINSGAKAVLFDNSTMITTGNWVNNGEFTPNDSKVIFEGTTNSTISNFETFTDVTINKTNNSAIILSNDIVINGNLNFQAGNLETRANDLNLGSSASISGESSGKYVVGNLSIIKNIGTASSDFGGVGLKLLSGVTNLGNVIVHRTSGANGEITINGKAGINRKWEIIPSNQPTQERNASFYWVSDDDNNVNLNFAKVWQSSDQSTWDAVGSMQNASSHSITVPINSLSFFTVNTASTINLPDDFTFNEDQALSVDFEPYIQNSSKEKNDDFSIALKTGKQMKFIKKSKNAKSKSYIISLSENTNISAEINGNIVKLTAGNDWNGTESVKFTLTESKGSEKSKILKSTLSKTKISPKITYYDYVNVKVLAVNDAPQIESSFPLEQTLTVTQAANNFSIKVSDIDNAYSELSFQWFIDDVNQENNDSLFISNFTVDGDYIIKGVVSDGEFSDEIIWTVHVDLGSGVNDNLLPKITTISQNYPNPFNPSTRICYQLKEIGLVQIYIYNSNGEKIRTLVNQIMQPGYYTATWNGKSDSENSVSTGLYFYSMKTKDYHQIKRAVLIK